MGAEGEKKRARPPPSAQQALLSLSFFPPAQQFFHHQPAISNPQCAREHERVCLMCVLEVRFGAGAIKALLKHF